MNLTESIQTNRFQSLNEHVRATMKMVSASAASALVVHNGMIVNEWYCGNHDHAPNSRKVDAQSQFQVGSIRKTYLGLAISLALLEGRIKSVDDAVVDYLDYVNTDSLQGTTIRHLLTHTHGLNRSEERVFPAGTNWSYNNTGVNLLIRIVQKVFGRPLAEVVGERVLEPYGFLETGWRKENSEHLVWINEIYVGEHGNEANLFVSTRDLGYWGHLHLTKGHDQRKQLLPRSIFEEALQIATPVALDGDLPRNGFFWWVQDRPRVSSELGGDLPQGSFQSLGIFGNAVLVIPQWNVVAVRMLNQTGGNPKGYDYLQDIQDFGKLVGKCVRG